MFVEIKQCNRGIRTYKDGRRGGSKDLDKKAVAADPEKQEFLQ